MRNFLWFVLVCFTLRVTAQNDEGQLEKLLYTLPDVQFKKYSKPGDPYLKYELKIRQPLDHAHLEKGYFFQSAVLTHKGFSRPVVMETEGYEMHYGGNEIEKILDANNLNIEHRYFGNSKPDSLQWEYLTFEQVVADLHHVNQLFRNIYRTKWISTGISRGGQTAIYYKRFYPDDVEVAIPYVAPVPNSLADKRIYHFLDTIGSAGCRMKIFNVQKFLLEHEGEAIDKLKWYAKGKGLTFDYFGSLGKAFEMWVLEYPFAFWQIGYTPCEKIPVNKSVDDYLEHLIIGVGGIEFLSDKSINDWVAHHYMARAQMGYYSYDLSRFRKHLRYFKGENPSAALVPTSLPNKPFDSTFTQGVLRWLDEKGNNILYIYGSSDTWSAARVIVSGNVNSKSFLISGANHFEARVKKMPREMQIDFAESLKKMLDINVDLTKLK
jgi:hypothetical protein